jgi:predicted RNase H-like nuclease
MRIRAVGVDACRAGWVVASGDVDLGGVPGAEWVHGTTASSPVFFDVTSSGAPPVTLRCDTGIR